MPPNDLDKRLKELRAQGLAWKQIADELDLSPSVLRRHAARLGLTKTRERHQERNAEIVRRAEAGELYKAIAVDVGLTHQQVSAVARAGGVRRKEALAEAAQSRKGPGRREALAARDAEIHKTVLAGVPYGEIAERWGLSQQSVSRIALKVRRVRRRRGGCSETALDWKT